jgi:hypothetical protein
VPVVVLLVLLALCCIAREQIAGTREVCTTGVVRALACGGWMDRFFVGTRERKKLIVSFTVIAWKK